jgi:16S rRNA C967 or C1407 C5-methylase (RsmB/RsmF family)/NOL1/NOP2/fmu family ribosome biogenesis protein
MIPPLPQAFCERIASDLFLGIDLLNSLETEPPVSVRLNPCKTSSELHINTTVPWCKYGYYLAYRPPYTLDPLFHAGTYYPQEAGSMMLDHILRSLTLPEDPLILDLCGSPGGKSTLLASFLNGRGVLVSNEIVLNRAYILRENMVKWGSANTIVTNNKPSDFSRLPHFFDVMLVDAPCSGEGMFRKDKDARKEWSEASGALCSTRQQNILSDSWDTLRPGGFLIYSTCTFNRIENEDIVKWIMNEFGAEIVQFPLPETVIADRDGLGSYCLPGRSQTEGYYVAVLQKPEDKIRSKQIKSLLVRSRDTNKLSPWVSDGPFSFYERKEWIYGLPETFEREMLSVQAALKIMKFGVAIGSSARKGLLPSEELALSPSVRSSSLPAVSVEKHQALSYLKGETFSLDGSDGWNLIMFNKEPLGWIKKIGHRFNNLYPKEWRIRMQLER